ncbi:molybdopterin molybdotransferase [Rhizobiales bacterium GAS191]|nr:molybdopterin molybdotransferase [Rhizobiales bacterium GAS113]SED94572.1 molybdopterin molybdotransferase [Rhizobiales bacterium GAS191]SEE53277.1 molybdopterin molybdotransferase [Rhizobiales bacterium GAS188]
MTKTPLLPVAEALARILATAGPLLAAESVPLAEAHRRTLAEGVVASRNQPPFASSAMDGYAVRAADVTQTPAQLHLIGTSAAGHAFDGELGPGEAVRIFTGAPIPPGADTIVIQEDTTAGAGMVTVNEGAAQGRHVRPAGLDFASAEVLLRAGHRLSTRDLALAAAAGFPHLSVRRRPRVAILATGDELVRPGDELRAGQIIASNSYAVAAMVEAAGGEAVDLGIARDDLAETRASIARARAEHADILVTLGGASVGDHDLVQEALTGAGMELGFWRIAMRPGKPLMHGLLDEMRVLGFPGNPVSSMVCALIFLRPLIRALVGDAQAGEDPTRPAVLGADVAKNDQRQDYLRASIEAGTSPPRVTPFARQDSSMMGVFARADALILREIHAPAARAGDPCRAILLDEWE